MRALGRSDFIRLGSSAVAGLCLAIDLPILARGAGADSAATDFAPSVWLAIHPDNTLTVTINKSEMGQGVATGLPTLVADELDVPFENVAVAFCLADAKYAYPPGDRLGTGGSTSMRTSWLILRQAGATARAMLIAAAAKTWGVDPASLTTEAGNVVDRAANRRASYGSLAAAASQLPVPTGVALKSPEQWNLIGKPAARLIDAAAKIGGTATFGLDVVVPGMRYAALVRPPTVNGKIKRVDATRAKAVKGVLAVVQVPQGVAVVATNTWAAFKGKAALDVEFDDGPNSAVTSNQLFADAERLLKTPGAARIAVQRGDPPDAGKSLEATYRGPYLAHAAMEPWNATANVTADACEVWVGTQAQTAVRALAARYSGLPLEQMHRSHDVLGWRLWGT